MTTLYLHIGTHRTATSSTQAFLHANAATLRSQGYLYPYNVKRHLVLFNDLLAGRRDVDAVAEDIKARAARRGGGIHSIILSDEDVCMRRDLSLLGKFRAHFDVKVVYALRRQDLWLESWYLQNVKWQWNKSLSHCTLPEFLDRRAEFFWADYDAYVRHLEDVFGRENVLLYVFEKAQMPEGPVTAFCRITGIDPSEMTTPPHTNSSRSAKVSEFMRCLPLDEAPAHYRGQLEKALAALDKGLEKTGDETSNLILDADTRARILAEHAAGNAALARRYFDRETLFSAPVPGPEAPVAPLELPADSYTLMQDFVAPFLRGLIVQNKEKPEKPKAGTNPASVAPKAKAKTGPKAAAKTGADDPETAARRAARRAARKAGTGSEGDT